MKKLALILALLPAALGAQTTVNISNTTLMSNFMKPGEVFGTLSSYGPGQLLRDYGQTQHAYFEGAYWQSAWQCGGGGSDSTHWFASDSNAAGYNANFFTVTPTTYVAMHQDGTSLGSGTITANTANTSTGMTFTLGTPLSATCTTGGNTAVTDLLYTRRRTSDNTDFTPFQLLPFLTGTASWSTDLDPNTNNTLHSLQLTNGQDLIPFDETNANAASTVNPSTQIIYLNLNGTYTIKFGAKCPVSACSIAYAVTRGGTPFSGTTGTVTPTVNSTPGAGWTEYSFTFTASETGSQTGVAELTLNTTGTADISYGTVIEGTTFAGNTTVLRDAVFRELQNLHLGDLRFMSTSDWPTDTTDMWLPNGARRTAILSTVNKTAFTVPMGYKDELDICLALHYNCWITLGHFNQPSDWAYMVTQLSTRGYTAAFAALGLTIWLEDGNEPWNSIQGEQVSGGGKVYAALSGAKMTAAHGATGYNGSAVKLIMDGWASNGQSYGNFSWSHTIMATAGCTNWTQSSCPDSIDGAPYTLGQLNSLTNGVVGTVGAPGVFLDEVADVHNWDSTQIPPLPNGQQSMLQMQSYINSTFGGQTAAYESSYSPNSGSASPTQLQMNQISGSVGFAENTILHLFLQRRDALISAPLNFFSFVDQPYNNGTGGTAMTSWTGEQYMAAGPGNLNTWTDVPRPVNILMAMANTAIGNNLTMKTCSQSGTPIMNYAGGQGSYIPANSSVPLVETFCFTDGSNHWTVLVWNSDPTNNQVINFGGANAPTGTVTATYFGGGSTSFGSAVNALTDNNANMELLNNATPATVVPQGSHTLPSNTTDTLLPGTVAAYTFTNGGTPTAATPTFSPVAGTYGSTQNVTVSCSTGSTACYSTSTTPATNGTTGCTTGTIYTSPVVIASTSTLHAICGGTGFLDGTPATAAYTITLSATGTKISGNVTLTGGVKIQ